MHLLAPFSCWTSPATESPSTPFSHHLTIWHLEPFEFIPFEKLSRPHRLLLRNWDEQFIHCGDTQMIIFTKWGWLMEMSLKINYKSDFCINNTRWRLGGGGGGFCGLMILTVWNRPLAGFLLNIKIYFLNRHYWECWRNGLDWNWPKCILDLKKKNRPDNGNS